MEYVLEYEYDGQLVTSDPLPRVRAEMVARRVTAPTRSPLFPKMPHVDLAYVVAVKSNERVGHRCYANGSTCDLTGDYFGDA